MEIITKDKIYFQKQDIRHLQSLEGHYSIAESIADELRYYVKNTVVTPQNKKEYLTIDAQVDTTDMWAFIFAPLYNEDGVLVMGLFDFLLNESSLEM